MTNFTFKTSIDAVPFEVDYQVDEDGAAYAQSARIAGSEVLHMLSEQTIIEIEQDAQADYAAVCADVRQSAEDSKAEERLWERAA